MTSAKHARSKSPVSTQSEVAAAEGLAWVSDCLDGGLCFIAKGLLIFENAQFGELVEAPRPPSATESTTLRSQLFTDAIVWNQETLGTLGSKTYRLAT